MLVMVEKFTLTEANFIVFAIKNYVNPQCMDEDEFNDDLKRIKYIKRLLNRYRTSGVLKERLILNHIIVLYNVFEIRAATRMLFFKLEKELWPALKTFLVYLHYMPNTVDGLQETIYSEEISIDNKVFDILKGI